MRLIHNVDDLMNGTVTYELADGQRVALDRRIVQAYGAEEVLRRSGYAHLLPAGRLDVVQRGKKIGTVPVTFDPSSIKSTSIWYQPRSGDFIRDGNVWVADKMLGPGDLEAVLGLRLDRS